MYSRSAETEFGGIETDLRVYRIHRTLERRVTDDPSQPGGPSQEGPADYRISTVAQHMAGASHPWCGAASVLRMRRIIRGMMRDRLKFEKKSYDDKYITLSRVSRSVDIKQGISKCTLSRVHAFSN